MLVGGPVVNIDCAMLATVTDEVGLAIAVDAHAPDLSASGYR
jgi:hypothetical protein